MIAFLFVAAAISATAIYFGFSGNRPVNASEETKEQVTEAQSGTEETYEVSSVPETDGEKWQEGMVAYNGKIYKYKDSVKNYLFMGIDNDDIVSEAPDGLSGGQSDAMFLLSIDSRNEKISVIAINRNTIVPVDIYDESGTYLGQMPLQICLQHGYGDGMKLSCSRSVEAVKRLFNNIPVSGYISLNMGGIPALNDAIGGIELTPVQDVSFKGITITRGVRLTLNGRQAYAYLRARDVDEFGSADKRLKRQVQYITIYLEKLMKDSSKAGAVYDAVSDYMVTSVDLVKLVGSAKNMEFSVRDMITIPGNTILNGEYEEFYPDPQGLQDIIMNVFYEEVE
ncbi:MAG: LCP family protein [Lachnospiraceae bacterium]|nr:LCP family protein [Lachnospiraceae bacterium]